MIKEENSALVGRTYAIPQNIIQFIQGKLGQGEGSKRIQGMISSPVASYEMIKRTKHDIERGFYKSDWSPVLNWINGILDRDRGMEDNRKRTPMELGAENRFKKTHDKDYGNNLTPLSGKQHIKITENQFKLIKNILKEQKKSPCETDGAIFGIWIEPKRVAVNVDLPFVLKLDEEEHDILKVNLHNAIELVLAKYFYKKNKK